MSRCKCDILYTDENVESRSLTGGGLGYSVKLRMVGALGYSYEIGCGARARAAYHAIAGTRRACFFDAEKYKRGRNRVVDWIRIKNEYINTDTSYRKLAEKYGVSLTAIANKSKAENWIGEREKHLNKTCTKVVQKTEKKIVSSEVRRLEKILELSDKITDKIEKAIGEMEQVYRDGETVDTGIVNTAKLRQIVQSLKDIQELQKPEEADADNANIVINISGAAENGS